MRHTAIRELEAWGARPSKSISGADAESPDAMRFILQCRPLLSVRWPCYKLCSQPWASGARDMRPQQWVRSGQASQLAQVRRVQCAVHNCFNPCRECAVCVACVLFVLSLVGCVRYAYC